MTQPMTYKFWRHSVIACRVQTWGTYGPKGNSTLTHFKVCDLKTDHLINILRTQRQLIGSTNPYARRIEQKAHTNKVYKKLCAIFHTLCVKRSMTVEQVKNRFYELDNYSKIKNPIYERRVEWEEHKRYWQPYENSISRLWRSQCNRNKLK